MGDSKAWDRLNVERREVTYTFCFRSVFDECWKTDGLTLRPEPVTMCPGGERKTGARSG
jgi:hypothetical protein